MIAKEDGSRWYNLQVQVKNTCKISSLAAGGSNTYAWCEAPQDPEWSGDKIKAAIKASITGRVLTRPRLQAKETKAKEVTNKESK